MAKINNYKREKLEEGEQAPTFLEVFLNEEDYGLHSWIGKKVDKKIAKELKEFIEKQEDLIQEIFSDLKYEEKYDISDIIDEFVLSLKRCKERAKAGNIKDACKSIHAMGLNTGYLTETKHQYVKRGIIEGKQIGDIENLAKNLFTEARKCIDEIYGEEK